MLRVLHTGEGEGVSKDVPTASNGRGAAADGGESQPGPGWLVVFAVLLVAAAFAGGWYASVVASRPDPDSFEEIAASLTAQYTAEHRAMTVALADEARQVHAEMMVTLARMNRAMPVEGGDVDTATAASAEEVEEWQEATEAALGRFARFGLGNPAFNGTVGSLRGSVQMLEAAAAIYAEALESSESQREQLIALAAAQRNNGAELWVAAAEQLDELFIAADLGHIHLFLPITGDSASVPLEFQDPFDH